MLLTTPPPEAPRAVETSIGRGEEVLGGKILRRQGDRGHADAEGDGLLEAAAPGRPQAAHRPAQLIGRLDGQAALALWQDQGEARLAVLGTHRVGMIQLLTGGLQQPPQAVESLDAQDEQQFIGVVQIDQQQAQGRAGLAAGGHGHAEAAQQAGVDLGGRIARGLGLRMGFGGRSAARTGRPRNGLRQGRHFPAQRPLGGGHLIVGRAAEQLLGRRGRHA